MNEFLPHPSDELRCDDDDGGDEDDDNNDLMWERSDGDFLPRPSDERCGTRGHVGIVNCTSGHVAQ